MNHDTTRAPEHIRRPRRRRRKQRRNPLPLILTAMLILFSLWKLTSELTDKIRSKQYLENLAAQTVEENTLPSEETVPASLPLQETEPMEFAPIQVDFEELRLYYPDVIAWLCCPGTSINYPVVQTDNNDYYVHRLPNGQESAGGSLFADCSNSWDFSDANTIIYGHDMHDGSMFGYLHNFDSQTYYEKHPVFYLLTPVYNYRMDIFCGAVVPSDSDLYRLKMNADELQSWLDRVNRASVIHPNTMIDRNTEHFLTLSTCSYEYEDARFVVIGSLKQIH